MTRYRVLIALVLLAIPVLVRAAFFYAPTPAYQNNSITAPDFASFTIPEPPTPSSVVKTDAALKSGKVVVIDKNHGNQFDPTELEPLTTALSARGALVEFDTGAWPLEARLKYASAYVLVSPATPFSSSEILLLQRFVSNGGRLLVFADPTRRPVYYDSFGYPYTLPDVNVTNPIIAPFGISFVNDYLYDVEDNEGNFRNVKFTDFAANPVTKDLKMVVFYGAHAVHAETGTKLATGGDKVLSSLTDRPGGLSPLALSLDGQVLVVGDFTFLTDPFNQVADNNLLLARVAEFALGGTRLPTLVNFPFLYQRPVNLLTTGDLQLTPELLSAVATLQKGLSAINIPLNIRAKASEDADTLVIGTLHASTDLTPYLKPFNLSFGENDETVNLPGFGKINTGGNGLLLFNPGPQTNTFVLLADNVSDLPKFIQLMSNGDLSACVVQGNVGVCALGSSSSSGGGGGYSPTPTPYFTPTPVGPLPTPTAAG